MPSRSHSERISPLRNDLPSGTVTFLVTDVEGSTKLLYELGAEAYAEALAEHRRVIREAKGMAPDRLQVALFALAQWTARGCMEGVVAEFSGG
jgi:hypothetical protein